MRTINFTEQDIKDCKLALVNQNLTSLQSAFLGQYINNLEGQLQQKENIIKEVRDKCEDSIINMEDYLGCLNEDELFDEEKKYRPQINELKSILEILDKEGKE